MFIVGGRLGPASIIISGLCFKNAPRSEFIVAAVLGPVVVLAGASVVFQGIEFGHLKLRRERDAPLS